MGEGSLLSIAMSSNDQNGPQELPLDANFVEQAEYIPENTFLTLNATHPDEESILRRLSVGGAKLLVGPRGCGKSTLMLKAYYDLLRSEEASTFPVYVNFKLSLKLEPLYQNTPNASFWFRLWLNLKIYEGIHKAIDAADRYALPDGFPTKNAISQLITSVESGKIDPTKYVEEFAMDGLSASIERLLAANDLSRCVLLLDDAAHAFSPRQQEDFFEFFRQIKSREVSPKAAIYPGITAHSPTFHVGHDAEQIDVWVKPDSVDYVNFMRSLAERRFGGQLPAALSGSPDALEFLAYASFGIPRSFLNMLRTIYHDEHAVSSTGSIDRRKLLDVAKQSRESSHNVYDSLFFKLPAYKNFVTSGRDVYQKILSTIKEFNRTRSDESQASEIGIKRPMPPEMEKVMSFFQYAGLVMPVGDNSRGVKGVFDIFMVHFGDLVTENAMIGRRTKSISAFVKAFSTQTHQVWPRATPSSLLASEDTAFVGFKLALPHCQNCGAERASEDAKFCHSCGSQLKTASLYDELTRQDISSLPISKKMVARIKGHSNIRTVRDILIDTDRVKLRSIPFVGPVRAGRIAGYAEEHVA